MDLYSGAVEGRIGRRGGAVEHQHWQISQERIGGVIKVDLVLRQSQVVGNSNHLEVVDERLGRLFSPGQSIGHLHGEVPLTIGMQWLCLSVLVGVVDG